MLNGHLIGELANTWIDLLEILGKIMGTLWIENGE